jgi:hypothetical protein
VINPVTEIALQMPLLEFHNQDQHNINLFTKQQAGKIQLCPSSCSAPTTLLLKNFEGNIYVNILDQIPGVVLSETTNIKSGSVYKKWIGLSHNSSD